ncbi:MAG: lipoprotein [Paludibacteraceae bacterium]
MKRISIWLMTVAAVLTLAGCGTRRSQASYDQPSKVLSANYDGLYVIRTQVRARNSALAFADAQRKAVREVIFDGVVAGSNGVQDLKPLVFDKNAYEKNEDYFNAFFEDGGAWTKYCSLGDRRSFSSTYQRTRAQMVQTVTVTVNRSALKRRLQADNIIPAEGRYNAQ